MAKIATTSNFDGLLNDPKLVVVDFWATWCGPCRMLSPTVEDIAEEMADEVTVIKCNVDDCEDLAYRYYIRNIPTLLFFREGEVVDRVVGLISKDDLVDKIKSLLQTDSL